MAAVVVVVAADKPHREADFNGLPRETLRFLGTQTAEGLHFFSRARR